MFLMTVSALLVAARAFAAERVAPRTVELALGRRIVGGEAVAGESPENPFRAGELVYASTLGRISETAAHPRFARERLAAARCEDGFIEHVWSRDGVEVARHYIPVGAGRRWRTWSRHLLEAGDYAVAVLAADGRRLASHTFTAFPHL